MLVPALSLYFTGHVREWTQGVRTLYLAYEAYVPMAEKKLAQIGAEMEGQWPGVKVAIAHRIGEMHISDIAVIIAVSSPHRKAAYEANEYAIERIKEDRAHLEKRNLGRWRRMDRRSEKVS